MAVYKLKNITWLENFPFLIVNATVTLKSFQKSFLTIVLHLTVTKMTHFHVQKQIRMLNLI